MEAKEGAARGERARVGQRQKQRQQERQSGTPRISPGISLSPNSRNDDATSVDDNGGSNPPQQHPPSPSSASSPMKVHHFEIGMAGRKEFIGEGGFTSAAFAGAGALGAAGVEAGGGGGESRRSAGKHLSRVGGNYLASAVAERRADVFAAKVCRLWPMQAPAIKLCWIEGREVGQAHAIDNRTAQSRFLTLQQRRCGDDSY